MRISSRLAKLVAERKPALGFWMNLGDPAIAQIAAIQGYDWVMLDTEHNPLTETQVQAMIYALGQYEVTPVIRVRANREEHVKWVLDAGAGGIIIPAVRDAADARLAVSISKYAPLGRRGFGPNRASGFWSNPNYTAAANHEIMLICQIEVASALAEVEEICRIPGIDAIWIGPGDLAQSLGHLGNPAHPDVRAATDKIVETANRCHKPWGVPAATVDEYRRWVARGGLLMTLGSDTRILAARAGELVAQARA